jgi:hypothetical protein
MNFSSIVEVFNKCLLVTDLYNNKNTYSSCGMRKLVFYNSTPHQVHTLITMEEHFREYNWATLFLGDINSGTWPSRLKESQMRQ